MMRFSVPQFIEVEDKIIGPISVRQFVVLLVSAGFIFIAFKLLHFIPFIFVGLLIFAFSGILAFAKINGQPFHFFLLVIMQSLKRPRVKGWSKDYSLQKITEKEKEALDEQLPPKRQLTTSRLTQLGLMVDTGGAYQSEDEEQDVLTLPQ